MSKPESTTPEMEKTDLTNISDQVVSDLGLGHGSSDAFDGLDQQQRDALYIEPEAERAVMKKFDKYLLPQAFIIILLNYLDRSNLGEWHSNAAQSRSQDVYCVLRRRGRPGGIRVWSPWCFVLTPSRQRSPIRL